MRKICLSLFIVFFSWTLTGCWAGREINQRAFVTAVAFDLAQPENESNPGTPGSDRNEEDKTRTKQAVSAREKFEISLQIPKPDQVAGEEGSGGGGGGKKAFLVLSATADSFLNGVLQIQQQLDRELFFGHVRLIMIGEDLAKEVGIERVVDFANRQFQIQRMSRLAVVQGRAKEVLSMDPPIGQSTSAYILNLISPSSGSSLIYISDLGKYNVYQADEGIEPVLPRVKKGKTSIETGGAAIIKDGKLAGWFTPFETRALDILQNEYKESNYVIASPLHPEDSIVVGLVDAGSVYRIKKEGRSFRVKIEITGSFETREFSGDYGPADLEGEDLQKRVAAKVRQEAESAIRRAQTVAADIFGIGRMIKARYPREWQKLDWTVEFSRLPIEVTVDMKWSQTVRRLGR